MSIVKYFVDNIQWDIDYYPDENGDTVELPDEVEVTIPFDCEQDHDDYISDYLSDEWGYCHHGFRMKETF